MLVVEVTCITTGATAATCGRFASTSATFTETDALLNAFIIDDPGGRTNTSAPMPYWRVFESLSMPSERPTISRIMLTSIATATMLIIERMGRWARLET